MTETNQQAADTPAAEAAYAHALMRLAQHDTDLATQDGAPPSRRSVALWMIEEVERSSEHLAVPKDVTDDMRLLAHRLRSKLKPVGDTPLRSAA